MNRFTRIFPRGWRTIPVLLLVVLPVWVLVSLARALPGCAGRPLPERARYGFVLDGQSPDGNRVAEGVELLRAGRIDTLIVSGVEIATGVHYSQIWVRQARLGAADRARLFEIRSACTSTRDEARMMTRFFLERNVDTAVVVTSDFHVWRAASIFESVSGPRVRWRFQGAPDRRWNGGYGWREEAKSWIMEWTKRVAWVLWERWWWLGSDGGPVRGELVGGEGLGRLPPPAWTD